MNEQTQNEIEYIEPTQEHVGQIVEVSDNGGAWHLEKLLGIIDAKERFVTSDGITVGWKYARIHCPKPQQKPVPVSSVPKETQPNDTHDTPKPIDWTKPVRTKLTKWPVTLVTVKGRGNYPIIGYVGDNIDLCSWDLQGNKPGRGEDPDGLENAPQHIQREYWANIYSNGAGGLFETKKDADRVAGTERIACVPIPIDCEKGEGL